MSTRSAIIAKVGGYWRGIYCHWDGYLEGVGYTLAEHYTDDAKVRALLALGDISILGKDVSPDSSRHHTFADPQDGVTLAYHRDRKDELNHSHNYPTPSSAARHIAHDGHVYVWDGARWTYNRRAIRIKKEA